MKNDLLQRIGKLHNTKQTLIEFSLIGVGGRECLVTRVAEESTVIFRLIGSLIDRT